MASEVLNEQQKQVQAGRESTREGGLYFQPNVDIMENESELQLKADMPGTTAEDISVDYHNGTLTVYGKVKSRWLEDGRYLLNEYGVGDFHRSFEINELINQDKISAEYTDGVLVLHLPKAEAALPRKIQVTTN